MLIPFIFSSHKMTCNIYSKIAFKTIRKYCNRCTENELAQQLIRNIGILAHIDAGKTTTTERMLYYSGKTHTMGEVHHGNTVTDHLEQERQRGITICSAAASFPWKEHRINLVDTPGHIDFTMEVEQSLGALDGAIVILDGSTGVEAQTVTVWSQADRHKLPRLVFANKMDRKDGNLEQCLKTLKDKLGARTLCLQLPIRSQENDLIGKRQYGNEKIKPRKTNARIIDVITLEQLTWNASGRGKSYQRVPLNGEMLDNAKDIRRNLVDSLTELDDHIADQVLASDSLDNIEPNVLRQAIRSATLKQVAVPILCGSAYKNIGIQPLLDAVVQFLPHPGERNHLFNCFGDDLCARVFKIVHDKQRGPLSFVRVMRGTLKKGSRVQGPRGGGLEVVNRLYEPLADDLMDIQQVDAGNIAVVAGLKSAMTGDLLTASKSSLNSARKKLESKLMEQKSATPEEMNFSFETKIPDPVFFCSVEPPSLSHATALDHALTELQREDPSLRVRVDEETGQTVLGGMGELHLEIIRERILSEYKVDAELGPMQIAYKERPENLRRGTGGIDRTVGNSKQSVKLDMSVGPANKGKEVFRLDNSPDSMSVFSLMPPKLLQLTRRGAEGALNRGPRMGCPVVEAEIILHHLEVARGTADTFIAAAAAQCVLKLLAESPCHLLEPIMAIQVLCHTDTLSIVLADLSRRRCSIQGVLNRADQRVVEASAPLNELLGYASALRTLSSGTASFSMQPHGFAPMGSQDEAQAVRSITGFD